MVEEVDDPYKIEHMLISATGYDAAVLDNFAKFVQTAAKMTDLNVAKRLFLIYFGVVLLTESRK